MNGKVTVNATVVLMDTPHTRSLVVKKDIQKKLIEVIQVSFQKYDETPVQCYEKGIQALTLILLIMDPTGSGLKLLRFLKFNSVAYF